MVYVPPIQLMKCLRVDLSAAQRPGVAYAILDCVFPKGNLWYTWVLLVSLTKPQTFV